MARLPACNPQEQRRAAGLPPRAPTDTTDGAEATPQPGDDLPPPQRPEFPPPSLGLGPAFAGDGALEGEPHLGGDVLMVASFLHSFPELLGLRPLPTADDVAQVRG